MKVNIVDSLMGSGKTTAMINHINKSDKNIKYLYVTPFLTEVERIIESCPDKNFKQPESYGSKIKGIKYLFEKGENIVSTHALFKLFDGEIINIARNYNYVLVMDEVTDVVETTPISRFDLDVILDRYATVGKGNVLHWHEESYTGVFEKYKKMCEFGGIAPCNSDAILLLFPINTFMAFEEIYIMTYLFDAQPQKYYYDYHGIDYNFLYVETDGCGDYEITNKYVVSKYPDFKNLIHITDHEKINNIGDTDTALSFSWYDRNKEDELMKQLKNNCLNFFVNHMRTKSQYNMWTTFKDYKGLLEGKGYTRGFVSSNMRATNEYREKTSVAYLINKYFNPYIKNFFIANGIKVDENAYALSEMLQFIWRSAIRDGKEISVYIPSKRMRNLLLEWIDMTGRHNKELEEENDRDL